jgi:hypothetical protein
MGNKVLRLHESNDTGMADFTSRPIKEEDGWRANQPERLEKGVLTGGSWS